MRGIGQWAGGPESKSPNRNPPRKEKVTESWGPLKILGSAGITTPSLLYRPTWVPETKKQFPKNRPKTPES